MLQLLRDRSTLQLLTRIKSWRTAKRTVRSTNAICDHIGMWSKGNPRNGFDENVVGCSHTVEADEIFSIEF